MKILLLKKTKDGPGRKRVGEFYEWTYKSTPDVQARVRAFKALKRDLPKEDPTCWEES